MQVVLVHHLWLSYRDDCVVTALLISFILGPHLILWLRRKQSNGQPIRPDGPNGHLLRKKGTPTMGGFLIMIALTTSTLLRPSRRFRISRSWA